MLGQGIHHDGEGEHVTAHQEDEEDHLGESKQFAADRACKNLASVGHVVYMWIGKLELADRVASIGCKETKADDQDDARDKAEGCKGGG